MMRNPFAVRGPFLGWTWGLIFLHVATFVLAMSTGARAEELLGWAPGNLEAGKWWTPFTYQFLAGRPLTLFFNVLSLWFLGMALEHEWGTFTYVTFYLCGVFGAWGAASLLGMGLSGSVFLGISYLITYAFLWPDTEFLVFFVLPVKVKWLAAIAAGMVLLGAFRLGPVLGLAWSAGMFGGVIFYLLALRPRRAVVRAAVAKVKEAGRVSGEEKLESKNREFFRRASAVRPPGGMAADAPGDAAVEALRRDLAAAVNPDVRVCKPLDYKGDGDDICIRCEGFAECTLRWLHGAPQSIAPPAPPKG